MRTQIGSYRIEAEIVSGGMGVVYRAWDERLHRRVAIKTFRRDLAIPQEVRERFVREGEANASLKPHPNIVTIYSLEELEDELFIVMEYLEGTTLEAMLAALPDGRMAERDALPLFEQILDAVEYVHQCGIVHRDLKPLNVMVCDGRAKVIDFGVALLSGMPRLTSRPMLLGTRAYMSPEQLEARDVDHRSDLYSIAIVLYRMLTGRDPFVAKEHMAQVYERLAGPPDPKSVVPELAPGVCAVLVKAMSYDRAHRFRSAKEFREALRDGKEGFLHVVVPPDDKPLALPDETAPPLPGAKRPSWVYSVPAGIAIGGAYALWLYLNPPLPTQQPHAGNTSRAKFFVPPIGLEPPPPTVTAKADPAIRPREKRPVRMEERPVEETAVQRAERQRREVEVLHKELDAALPPIEAAIQLHDFRSATIGLDDLAWRVKPHSAELSQLAAEIERLREAVRDGEAEKNRQDQQAALWEARLNDIQIQMNKGEFVFAQQMASSVLADTAVPEAIAARAKQFLEQAQSRLSGAWQSTTVGTTTNKQLRARKPSPPPRK